MEPGSQKASLINYLLPERPRYKGQERNIQMVPRGDRKGLAKVYEENVYKQYINHTWKRKLVIMCKHNAL